jgi:DNA polymerase beta
MNHKHALLTNLKLLKQQEQANRNVFKVKAYSKVIEQIEKIASIRNIDDLQGVSGIGISLKQKIQQILDDGSLPGTEALQAKAKELELMETFASIMAIGPVKAKELVEVHKISSMDDLKSNGRSFLNEKQIMGLKYHDDFLKRIPRREMIKHDELISKALTAIDPKLTYKIAGSYRRGAASSGDIDVLVTHPEIKESDHNMYLSNIVEHLTKAKYLVDNFALGEKKYNGVCRLPNHKYSRRIDIMVTPPSQFPFALLYFTGSQTFNVRMRNHALSLGYSLNEYGLKYVSGAKKQQTVDDKFLTEEDIFDFLHLKYTAPESRIDNVTHKFV